jgi:hypothetical protein
MAGTIEQHIDALAKVIYELDPYYEDGEYVDGFLVSQGGHLTWEQACRRDAEFEGVRGMLPITKFAREAARAVLIVRPDRGAKLDDPVAEERERCAKIADQEAAEYERQRMRHNTTIGALPEHGWIIHAKLAEARNIAALIRGGK